VSVRPWNVSGSGLRFFASSVSSSTASDADDVSEVDVDVARPARVAHELDAPRAVDEVEEDQLPHLPPRHDAAREPSRLVDLASRVDLVGGRANIGDRVAIGESLGRRHAGQPIRPPTPLLPG
jgi:hypothetical protein